MKKIVRHNITDLPYSLHDAVVTGLEVLDDRLLMLFQYGFMSIGESYEQVWGKIEFERVDWDFSYIYLLEFPEGLCGNAGDFIGKKMGLVEFINQCPNIKFEIVDETYGYNQSKFDGYLWGDTVKECRIEIYHLGEMNYLIEE